MNALRSRRLALVAAVAVLGLTACGSDQTASDTTAAPAAPATTTTGAGATTPPTTDAAPRVIEVGEQSAPAAETASDAPTAESKMRAHVVFAWAGDAADLTAPAPAWFFAPGTVATEDDVRRLAEVFDVSGELRQQPEEMGGGWIIGSDDWSEPTVSVSTDSMGSWWYSAPAPEMDMPICEVVDPLPPDATGDTATSAATEECPMPEPPENVPSAAAAEESARAMLQELGLDPAAYVIESYADEWSATVNAYLLLDGVKSNVSIYVSFGANGAVSYAGGFLATPQRGDDYPRIGVEAAVERLNAPMLVDDVATLEDSSEATRSDAAAPVDTGDVEPVTITLTSVTETLEQLWSVDETIWLLPAYSFMAEDGSGPYTIIAVEDRFLDQPEPDTTIDPMPVDTAPVDTGTVDTGTGGAVPGDSGAVDPPSTPSDADAEAALIGLSVEEATKLAESYGWQLRVVREDGVDLAVTADYSETRRNVAVEDGIVTEVLFVG